MGKTLFLHIGAVKTGSTSIQNFLASQQDGLVDVLYFDISKSCYLLNALAKKCGYSKINPNTPHYQCDADQLLAEIAAELQTSPEQTIIISQENFSRIYQDHRVIACACDFFKECGLEVKVILYVRRQDQWLESWYQEHIKQRDSFADTFTEWQYGSESCDHHRTVQLWEKAFGKENVVVRPFEKGQFADGDLIEDFCRLTQITRQSDSAAKKVNVRLDIFSTELLRLFHLYGITSDEHQLLLESLTALDYQSRQHYSYLSMQDRVTICAAYEESNARLAKDYFPQNGGKLFFASPEEQAALQTVEQINTPEPMETAIQKFLQELRKGRYQEQKKKFRFWPVKKRKEEGLPVQLEGLRKQLQSHIRP